MEEQKLSNDPREFSPETFKQREHKKRRGAKTTRQFYKDFGKKVAVNTYLAIAFLSVIVLALAYWYLWCYSWYPQYNYPSINVRHIDGKEKILNIDGYIKTIKVNIRKFEGSVAYKTNNPCNLAYARQPGAWQYGRFAAFRTPELGYRACILQIRLDQKRDKTLERFLAIYAPAHENDTQKYINTVATNLFVGRKTLIADIDLLDLVAEIMKFESQSTVHNI